MAYQHGVRVQEQPTSIVAPILGTAGLQVVFGTAPVNLAADPYKATNKPVIAYNWGEAVSQLGYSAEKNSKHRFVYTLCESMYANFKLFGVAPVIFINVLDPKKHKKKNESVTVTVEDMEAVVKLTGILKDTVKVTAPSKVKKYVAVTPTVGDDPTAEGWFVLADGIYTAAQASTVEDGVTYYRRNFVDELDADGNPAEQGYFECDEEAKTYKLTEDTEAAAGKSYYSVEYIAVSAEVGSNPASEGWFVLEDGSYSATTDTSVVNGKAYYAQVEEAETVELVLGTDYLLSFDDDGFLVVTLITEAMEITVESISIDPTAVKAADIIGASSGAEEKGMEVLRQVYPKFGMTPGLLLAPGWSHISDVGVALAAKCEEINGYFTCEAFVDIDSTDSGCTLYADVKAAKEKAGCTSKHVEALWPCIAVGSTKFWYSAIQAAATAYLDAANDDVPNLSPSNKLLGVTGTVLADAIYTETVDDEGNVMGGEWDKEVLLDQLQANAVNGFGVTTALNSNGWRNWGNNTAAYPATTDPKDRWFCCRRFFSWWGNSFILTYAQKVDDPSNIRLIESIVDSENIRGNAYVSQGKCAAAYIEFNADENDATSLLNGKLQFHQHLAPYVPAEDIVDTLEFDPDALASALTA